MRRTLLAVLVAVTSFVATSAALVYGFQLLVGRSTPPAQAAGAAEPSTRPSDNTSPNAPAPVSAPSPDTGSPPAEPAAPSDAPSTDDPAPTSGEPEAPVASAPKRGLLSQDFAALGLDDPTTLIDESLRSACDVVGGTIAGPALCRDR